VDSLAYARTSEWLRLLSFCVMPDHCHLLFVVLHKKSLSDVVGSISKFTSMRMARNDGLKRTVWQEGFFDHRCRDVDDAIERIDYIESNPVRAGLVDRPEMWAYSSANPIWAGMLDRKWYSEQT
jgi:putative transposase